MLLNGGDFDAISQSLLMRSPSHISARTVYSAPNVKMPLSESMFTAGRDLPSRQLILDHLKAVQGIESLSKLNDILGNSTREANRLEDLSGDASAHVRRVGRRKQHAVVDIDDLLLPSVGCLTLGVKIPDAV